jgi:hypothetical protein
LKKRTPLAEMGKNGNNKNTDMRKRIWYKILLLTPHSASLAPPKLSQVRKARKAVTVATYTGSVLAACCFVGLTFS